MKRWCCRILLCVALGVVLTYATSIACHYAAGPSNAWNAGALSADEEDVFMNAVGLHGNPKATSRRSMPHSRTAFGVQATHFMRTLPALTSYEEITFESSGVPFKALEGMAFYDFPSAKVKAVGGWVWLPRAKRGSAPGGGQPVLSVLPLQPVWLPFIGDVLVWSAVALATGFLFQATRREIRRSRGRCPQCGFNLCERGDTPVRYMLKRGCPECGWGREAHPESGAES